MLGSPPPESSRPPVSPQWDVFGVGSRMKSSCDSSTQTGPNTPRLPCLAEPGQALPRLPCLPRQASPHRAVPRLACRALPGHAAPRRAGPRRAQPSLAAPGLALPAVPGQARPGLAIASGLCDGLSARVRRTLATVAGTLQFCGIAPHLIREQDYHVFRRRKTILKHSVSRR